MIVQSLEIGSERRIGPGARLASSGSTAGDEPAFWVFRDDLGRLSAASWGRGDAGAAADFGSGVGAGAGPADGRPSAAAPAMVSPRATAAIDAVSAMALDEGSHMVEI